MEANVIDPQGASEQSAKHSPAEHLRPHWWVPGQSGNPGGRKKRKIITDALEEALLKDGEAALKELIRKTVDDLLTSEQARGRLLGEVLNRLEGKVKDEVEVSGALQTKVLVLRGDARVLEAKRVSESQETERLNPPTVAGALPPCNENDGKVKAPPGLEASESVAQVIADQQPKEG